MELKQSYIMSIARARLSLYEQKILLKMVQSGQARVQGLPLGRIREQLEHNFNSMLIEIPMRELMKGDTKHYEHILRAAQELTRKNFTYIGEKGDWVTFSWVMRAEHKKATGKLYLLVDKRFYDCLYNFSNGYSHYELERALSFKNPSSVKMYALCNGQHRPMTWPIDALKRVFGVEDKYSRTNDFIRKVIEPAYKELKQGEHGNYFEYTTVKKGNKITALVITTVQRASQTEAEAMPKAIRQWLPVDYYRTLIQHAGFTSWQVAAHKELLHDLSCLPHGMDILLAAIQRVRAKRDRIANPQGYIINTLRAEVKAAKITPYGRKLLQ